MSHYMINFSNWCIENWDLCIGSHTIGLARCAAFNNRLFNFSATGLPDSSMDTNMLLQLQALCGNASSHGYSADPNLGNSTTPLDRDSTNDFVTITFRICPMERPYLVPTKFYWIVMKLIVWFKSIALVLIVSLWTLPSPWSRWGI